MSDKLNFEVLWGTDAVFFAAPTLCGVAYVWPTFRHFKHLAGHRQAFPCIMKCSAEPSTQLISPIEDGISM